MIGCRSAGAARGHGVESGSRGDLGRGTHRGAGRRKSPATGSGPHRPETDDVDRAGMGRSASTGGNRNCGQFRIGSYLIKGLHRTDGLAPLDRSPQRLRSSLSGRSRATYCANGFGSMTGSFTFGSGWVQRIGGSLLLWRRVGSAGEWPLGIRQVGCRLARTTVSINMPAQNTTVPAMNKLGA